MREGRPVDFVRGMQRLGAECRCRVPPQRDVVAKFSAATGGRLNAGVRHHSYHDDLLDTALLELEVKVGVSKSVLAPMLLNDDVAWLRHQIGMPVAAPHAVSEDGFAIGGGLARAGMTPSVIIALAPAPVRYVEHRDACAPRRLDERA